MALARRADARKAEELFEQVVGHCQKPLKRLRNRTTVGLNNPGNIQGSGGNRSLRWLKSPGHGVELVYRVDGSLDKVPAGQQDKLWPTNRGMVGKS